MDLTRDNGEEKFIMMKEKKKERLLLFENSFNQLFLLPIKL